MNGEVDSDHEFMRCVGSKREERMEVFEKNRIWLRMGCIWIKMDGWRAEDAENIHF